MLFLFNVLDKRELNEQKINISNIIFIVIDKLKKSVSLTIPCFNLYIAVLKNAYFNNIKSYQSSNY